MISIIIPTHRSPHVLDAVRSCASQGFRDFEIIVVFNEASELKEIKNARVIAAKQVGVNRARNAGALAAQGEILFFMDDDCQMKDPDFLNRLLKLFTDHPEVSLIGGGYENPPSASSLVKSYNTFTRLWIKTDCGTEDRGLCPARNLLGGNLAARRHVFDQGFHFNDEIVSGGDETEWTRRLEAAAFRIAYAPELNLEHHASPSWKHAVLRSWKQNQARGQRRLKSGTRPKLPPKAIVAAWPHLLLHMGVGSMANLYGRARRRILDHSLNRG